VDGTFDFYGVDGKGDIDEKVRKESGKWKVDRVVENQYQVRAVYDNNPTRVFDWAITLGDDAHMKLMGKDGVTVTLTRIR
jgi:hypothetical protein